MGRFRLAVFNTQPPHLYRGGVERRIMETAKRLTKDAEVTVYSGTKAGFNTPTQIDGINLAPITSTDRIFPLDNWTFNRNLTKNATKIQADVYECHNVSSYGLLKEPQKKPFIHTIHGVLADEYLQAKTEGRGSLRGWIANQFMQGLANREAEIAKKADLIVTISQYSIQKILQNYTVPKEKIRLVPNGVDTEKFKPQPVNVELKRSLGVDGKPCALFVGNLVPRKGLPFLIEAARKVTQQIKDAQFLIVGDGPQKSTLKTQIQNHYLTGHFHFLDNIPDTQLQAFYNLADLFVLPSIQEGQGIVLLEAQACGKPVVAFDVGGVNEAVQNGETGFLVEGGNVNELANALVKLLADRTLGEKMGFVGRRFVEENFTWDLCAQRMLDVYREALRL
ncbi:MAG: glycosyltransferase family 4 protein [Candidatus Bathyarchaeota archaeon]|nr:glycosyltransferase family 4 protein [Candidatus Bathyarchaeota archaeon]